MAAKPVVVDFSDTETRGGKKGSGGRKHYPPGDYAVKCIRAATGKSADKETPRIEVTYRFTQGKLKGKEIRDDLYLTPKSLWRVRQTMEAMGIKVPSKKVKVDPSKFVGKTLAISIDDDEYDDKIYSRVTDSFLLSEFEDGEDDDTDDEDEEDDETEDEEDEESEDGDEDEEGEEESSDDDDDLEDLDLDI